MNDFEMRPPRQPVLPERRTAFAPVQEPPRRPPAQEPSPRPPAQDPSRRPLAQEPSRRRPVQEPSRRPPALVVRLLALALLTATGVGLLELGAARRHDPRLALAAPPLQRLFGPVRQKHFFWRKDLSQLVLHKNQAQAERLLGPPDGVFKHGDGRQLWFYHRLSADRHTRTVDGMTILKIAPDGRIIHISFRELG